MTFHNAFTSGQMLLHYRLIEPIGEGAMGVVWKALDTTLERQVALKVLPTELTQDPDRLRRFAQEARLLAALNHPNIAAIYGLHEVDTVHFFTMELVEGADLSARLKRGPLPLATALTIGTQVAAALEATHARGITHRDLKPANIRLTTQGTIKVLDFGVAKGRGGDPGATADEAEWPTATQAGTSLGTPGYMSPEQARGDAVDARSDVWAFGCVLYETLASTRAFPGRTVSDVLAAVLRDEPDWSALPSTVPESILDLLRHCLTKDVEGRLSDIRGAQATLAEAISGVSGSVVAVRTSTRATASVAVLPFTNMSGDAENQYFSDGLAEDLIDALTRLPGLHVASRGSAFRFRETDRDIRRIGADLHVGAILEGSVRRAGNRLRVTAELVKVTDGNRLWSERYDREMVNVFDIQDDIVASIVKALAPALLGGAKDLVRRLTDSLDAYELYLKGRHYWHQRLPDSMRVAIQCFEQAIGIDPTYALAYAGLADCYSVPRVYGWVSATDNRPRALEAVTRAMDLDPWLPEAHFSRGLFIYYFEPAWHEAEVHFKNAIAMKPRWSQAHLYHGLYLACDYRFDEAVAQVDLARELDPLSPFVHAMSAVVLNVAGRFQAAEQAARRALDLQPDYPFGILILGVTLYGLGRLDEGIAAVEHAVSLSRAPIFVGTLGLGYARGGRADDARRLLRELEDRQTRGEYVAPATLLTMHVGLQDVRAIRDALEGCSADATPVLSVRAVAGLFLEPFRSDPEIDRLLDRLNDGARPPRT